MAQIFLIRSHWSPPRASLPQVLSGILQLRDRSRAGKVRLQALRLGLPEGLALRRDLQLLPRRDEGEGFAEADLRQIRSTSSGSKSCSMKSILCTVS